MADSPVCYRLQSGPLHCAGYIPQPTLRSSANLVRQPGENPCVPKVAESGTDLVAALLARLEPSLRFRFSLIALGGQRESKRPRDYVRPENYIARDASHGQDVSNIGARRCLSPKTKAIAPRGYARCKPATIIVRSVISAPPPLRWLHCGGQKQPNSLAKPNWSETPSLDSAACWSRLRGRTKISRPSFHYVPPAGTRIQWPRATATTPGHESRRPDKIDAGFAALLA